MVNLVEISKYLGKNLPDIEVKIIYDKLFYDENFNTSYKTPLFSVYKNDKEISISYYKNINISLDILSFLKELKYKFTYSLIEENSIKKIVFTTDGNIPYRWFDIIHDFVDDTIEYKIIKNINYEELLEKIPDYTLKKIILNSLEHQVYTFIVEDKNWGTLNGKFTDYTKNIFDHCDKFLSIPPIIKHDIKPYKDLFACEGGIEICNKYLDDFINTFHVDYIGGSIRNECKGKNQYRTNKNVKIEELIVLYLCLKKLGCKVSQLLHS